MMLVLLRFSNHITAHSHVTHDCQLITNAAPKQSKLIAQLSPTYHFLLFLKLFFVTFLVDQEFIDSVIVPGALRDWISRPCKNF